MKHILFRISLFISVLLAGHGPLAAQTLPAGGFVDLPTEDFPITGEGLPVFSTQIKLGTGSYAGGRVRIEYPEYRPLTKAEIRVIAAHALEVPDTIVPRLDVGYSRKVAYADVSFCPIVRKQGIWLRLVSCKLTYAFTPAMSASSESVAQAAAERWKKASVLAEGRWVKIRVEQEGIYCLSPEQLSDMGFADPSKVRVYGYGGRIQEEAWTFSGDRSVPDDLCQVACYRNGGSIYFFAEGTVRWTWDSSLRQWRHENQPYSRYSYYFLTESNEAPDPWTVVRADAPTGTEAVSVVRHYAVLDDDAAAFYEGGREMYDDYDFSTGNTRTYRLTLPGYVEASRAMVNVGFAAASPSGSVTVQVNLNGTTLGNMSIRRYESDESAYESRSTFSTDKVSESNDFQFTTTSGIAARLNYVRVTYDRQLDAQDVGLPFTANASGAVMLQLANATRQTHLWRIATATAGVVEMEGSLEGQVLSVPVDDASQRYVVFDEGASYPSPEYVGEVESQNLHADGPQDMIIIIPASGKLAEQAERLAEMHRDADGLRVRIVRADQLYNEFSSGTPDASAYRRYAKMLYDRAERTEDMPKYLLLFGDCAWDNRMLTPSWDNASPDDYLLAFEVNDQANQTYLTGFAIGALNSYVTDDFYGWLDDSEGGDYSRAKLDLAIGRLPCSDPDMARVMVDKIIDYHKNKIVGAWKNQVYMLADDVNNNLHMRDAEDVVESIVSATGDKVQLGKVYWDAYPIKRSATGNTYPQVSKMLRDHMSHGAIMFNYMGHGSPTQVSTSRLLVADDFSSGADGRLPLWVLASCEITPYDRQEADIGRNALYNPTGGAIAVVCASRSVYSNYNRSLNQTFSRYVFTQDAGGSLNTMGEALRLAKVAMVDNAQDVTMNKLKYVLLGDPALALRFPTAEVVLDSINGVAISGSTLQQLEAGAVAKFSGYVADANGRADTDFFGTVTATVMDRLETIICRNNSGSASSPMVYTDRTKQLYEGSDSVRQGRFSLYMPVPRDISYTEDRGRISLYAVNNEHTQEAHGICENVYFNGTYAGATQDTLGPEVFLYLNTPDFPNGGVVSSNPVFMAKIQDDSGINASSVSLGHDMELTIDGNTSEMQVLNDYFAYDFGSYSSGLVTYPLDGLADGRHTLSFRVWDVNNNSTATTLDFYVGAYDTDQTFTVHATENPASTQTAFVVVLDEVHADCQYTVDVYSVSGTKVWSYEGKIPSASRYGICDWNLRGNGNAPLPSGIYFYRAKARSESQVYETDAQKLILLNP